MQFRQLRYFVKIVDAGSFSRAAALIHIAQPALSQQIAELEGRLGVSLLHRSARGVRPTAAGEILYREAFAILKQLDQLPGIVRSSNGVAQGTVSVGLASLLGPALVGGFVEACRSGLDKVSLKLAVSDSAALREKLSAQSLDLALVFEDEAAVAAMPVVQQVEGADSRHQEGAARKFSYGLRWCGMPPQPRLREDHARSAWTHLEQGPPYRQRTPADLQMRMRTRPLCIAGRHGVPPVHPMGGYGRLHRPYWHRDEFW